MSPDDKLAAEGWHWADMPIEDLVPWQLQIDVKAITESEGKYIVVFGYLVASEKSVVLFPSEEASKSGKTDGALILATEDSPAMRWLFPRRHSEGFYAVGGVFSRSSNGPMLGHLAKIRFAMKKEDGPNQPSEPTPPSITDRAAARSAPAGGVAHL